MLMMLLNADYCCWSCFNCNANAVLLMLLMMLMLTFAVNFKRHCCAAEAVGNAADVAAVLAGSVRSSCDSCGKKH